MLLFPTPLLHSTYLTSDTLFAPLPLRICFSDKRNISLEISPLLSRYSYHLCILILYHEFYSNKPIHTYIISTVKVFRSHPSTSSSSATSLGTASSVFCCCEDTADSDAASNRQNSNQAPPPPPRPLFIPCIFLARGRRKERKSSHALQLNQKVEELGACARMETEKQKCCGDFTPWRPTGD